MCDMMAGLSSGSFPLDERFLAWAVMSDMSL